MRISYWSSDVCSSDLFAPGDHRQPAFGGAVDGLVFEALPDQDHAIGLAAIEQVLDPAVFVSGDLAQQHAVTAAGEFVGQQGQHGHHEGRSEEHTSELQSLMRISCAVFHLKKKKTT